MKISRAIFISQAGRRCKAQSAFTMVEIALCLAIIGFALVAIIGVLPTGLNVQRDNRQETIISQDATYFMDAIRSGARGLDDLTNYVDVITNVITYYDAAGNFISKDTYGYTYIDTTLNGGQGKPEERLTNGHHIIGLLSRPKYVGVPGFGPFASNYVAAYVRAISGNASEKAPQDSVDIRDLSFGYKLVSEVVPFMFYETNSVNYKDPMIIGNTNEIIARSNNWMIAKNIQTNLYDLRLRFLWPLLPGGQYGNGRQTYRTLASGYLTNDPSGSSFYHLESRSYARDDRVSP